jgi:hypothetical protein
VPKLDFGCAVGNSSRQWRIIEVEVGNGMVVLVVVVQPSDWKCKAGEGVLA